VTLNNHKHPIGDVFFTRRETPLQFESGWSTRFIGTGRITCFPLGHPSQIKNPYHISSGSILLEMILQRCFNGMKDQ
jgi:hypothetical protein